MFSFKLMAAAAVLASAGVAHATASVQFVLTGDYNATLTLPTSPVPAFSTDPFFTLSPVLVTSGGPPVTTTINFFAPSFGGGLNIFDINGFDFLFSSVGDVLFTGPTSSPTFRTGTFSLSRFSQTIPGNGTLTISTVGAGAVPEPASWAMLIAGFGLVGAVMRRREAGAANA